MNQQPIKRLRMFAGPNGSGKTSLARRLAREFSSSGEFHLHQFVNADEILLDLQHPNGLSLTWLKREMTLEEIRTSLAQRGRLRTDHPFFQNMKVANFRLTAPTSTSDAYVAATIADLVREELLAAGRSFSFETVMSHRSKVEFFAQARASGYRTYLYFVAVDDSDLNIERVKDRAGLGGHDVPEDKIVERYRRSLELLGPALSHAHRAYLFDNSGQEPICLAELTPAARLQLRLPYESLPFWFKEWVPKEYSQR